MKILTATEISRNFSRVLDELERGSEEIIVMRGKHPVAKMVPGAPRLTALEALADLYRTLDDADGRTWLKDMANGDRQVRKETREPVGVIIDTSVWVDVERGRLAPADVAAVTGDEPVYLAPPVLATMFRPPDRSCRQFI